MSDELTIDDLTPGELDDLTAQGRIVGNKILPAPEAPQEPVASSRRPLDPSLVPEVPPEIKARLAAAKDIQSSFVHSDLEGNVTKASEDGGTAALEKTKEVNPDWAGKTPEEPIEFDDKMRFLACVLGAERFYKDYPLLGGLLVVRFQTLTEEESNQCGEQVWNDEKIDGKVATGHDGIAMRNLKLRDYQLVGSLVHLKKKDDVPLTFNPFGTTSIEPHVLPVRVRLTEFNKTTPVPLACAIRLVFGHFERLTQRLTFEMENPSFWIAASAT